MDNINETSFCNRLSGFYPNQAHGLVIDMLSGMVVAPRLERGENPVAGGECTYYFWRNRRFLRRNSIKIGVGWGVSRRGSLLFIIPLCTIHDDGHEAPIPGGYRSCG